MKNTAYVKRCPPYISFAPAKTLIQWNGFFYSFLLNLVNNNNPYKQR